MLTIMVHAGTKAGDGQLVSVSGQDGKEYASLSSRTVYFHDRCHLARFWVVAVSRTSVNVWAFTSPLDALHFLTYVVSDI